MASAHIQDLIQLVERLIKLPTESEWFEFKLNNADPNEIGRLISALSNTVAILNKRTAYVIWGIEDASHNIVGTNFSPSTAKEGGEELENWLTRLIQPRVNIQFHEISINGMPVVILDIDRASHYPTSFKGEKYIRIGSYIKSLKDYPEKEKLLWQVFDSSRFERNVAAKNLTAEAVLNILDYPSYFYLLKHPLPENRDKILEVLVADAMIEQADNGNWNILNLAAILFCRQLNDFKHLKRKTIRVIQYSENNRITTQRELEFATGYALSIEEVIKFISSILPANEIIGPALRKNVTMYPLLAIRELVVNAIIHQDFLISGAAPMIEIFQDRIEITNPGKPLTDTMRLLDNPPRSRNEDLASFMRRIDLCEERGSGVDKVVEQTELYQLPAPIFATINDNTRVVLQAHKPLKKMTKEDRIGTCYLHACLKYVDNDHMTNTTLRARFGIEPKNSADASRIIKSTLEAGLIRIHDTANTRKAAKYVPFWA